MHFRFIFATPKSAPAVVAPSGLSASITGGATTTGSGLPSIAFRIAFAIGSGFGLDEVQDHPAVHVLLGAERGRHE